MQCMAGKAMAHTTKFYKLNFQMTTLYKIEDHGYVKKTGQLIGKSKRMVRIGSRKRHRKKKTGLLWIMFERQG